MTSGIADGDLVVCSNDQPRVMAGGNGAGTRGLLVEAAATNSLIQSAQICNAAWADVGTPNCSADSAAGPWGTTTMDLLTDNDGAAYEGRSQSIVSTSATQHSVSCYVKAGTATNATITMVGAGNGAGDCTGTATDLSSTTSTRISCASSAAYTGALTSVVVTIKVGTAASDQGTLLVESCDHIENRAFVTSHIPTVAVAVTRAADAPIFTLTSANITAPWSFAGSVQLAAGLPTVARLHGTLGPAGLGSYVFDSYSSSTWFFDSTQTTPNTFNTAISVSAGTLIRAASYHDGTLANGCINGTCGVGVARAWTTINSVTTYKPGMYSTANGVVDGVVSRICWQPGDSNRCR